MLKATALKTAVLGGAYDALFARLYGEENIPMQQKR